MNRLLNGFNYFWNKKPSEFKDKDVLLLHKWQEMLKASVNKTTEPLEEGDLYEIAKNIFSPDRIKT